MSASSTTSTEQQPQRQAPRDAGIDVVASRDGDLADHREASLPAARDNGQREPDNTWELSKENVMPLARGRKVESIRRAFGAVSSQEDGAGDDGRESMRTADVMAELKR